MYEFLVAFIIITGIMMSGFRRAKLLNEGYAIQSLFIAMVCLYQGIQLKEYHYFILFALTLVTKVVLAPIIINKSISGLKKNRETELIINSFWSYILSGVSAVLIFLFLVDVSDLLLKAGVVLIIVGAILMVGVADDELPMLAVVISRNRAAGFSVRPDPGDHGAPGRLLGQCPELLRTLAAEPL